MTISSRVASVFIAAFITALLYAEDGIVVISVTDPKSKPMPGVVLSTKGDGATASPTDVSGKTRLRLAPQTRSGSWVSLQITRVAGGRDMVFISPWDQRVIIPPFSNESENYVPVVIADRSNRDILSSRDSLTALASKAVAQTMAKNRQNQPAPSRDEVLKQLANEYGLTPDEIDSAIRAWSRKATTPYDKGVTALYKGEYREASAQLSQAVDANAGATATTQRDTRTVDSAFFLGWSLFEEGKYPEAAAAFRRALQFRQDDTDLLLALGLASANIQSQTGTATHGGTLIQAQASNQYNFNYITTVKNEGTAGTLIAKASSSSDLESLLGFINRDAGAALGLWETQLRKYYAEQESSYYVTSRVEEATKVARQELRDIQKRTADGLAKQDLAVVKAQLFLLDGLASELAAKAGRSRPVSASGK
jgi:tetratricopeptide (TPR) repeat protein